MPSASAATVGPSPAEPSQSVEHQVRLRLGDEADQAFGTGQHLTLGPGLGRPRGGVHVGEGDMRSTPVRLRLPDELLPVWCERQAQHLQLGLGDRTT